MNRPPGRRLRHPSLLALLAAGVMIGVSACAGSTTTTGSSAPTRTPGSAPTSLVYGIELKGSLTNLQSVSTQVVALDAQSGAQVWHAQVPGASFFAPLAVINGTVYAISSAVSTTTSSSFSAPGHLSAFDGQTGALLWEHDNPNTSYSELLTDGSALVALSSTSSGPSAPPIMLIGLNPSNGSALWQKTLGTNNTPYVVFANGAVVVAFSSGANTQLQSFNASDGSSLWSKQESGFVGNMLADNGAAYLGVNGGLTSTFAALNPKTGVPIWQKTINGNSTVYAASSGVVYVNAGGSPGQLLALNESSGTQIWQVAPPLTGSYGTSSAADANGYFVLGEAFSTGTATPSTMSDPIFALSATSGAKLWNQTIQVGASSLPTLFAHGTTLYISTGGFTSSTITALDDHAGGQRWSIQVPGFVEIAQASG